MVGNQHTKHEKFQTFTVDRYISHRVAISWDHPDQSLYHQTTMASALTAADIHTHYHMLVELIISASVLPHNDPSAIDQIVAMLESF